MPTWSGWENEFLRAANINGGITTPPLRTFMAEWARHAPGSCRNNPNDLSMKVAGSTRCGDTIGGFGRSQNYDTHAHAAHAFSLSMHTDWVHPLLAAMNTGNPFQIGDRTAAVAVLNRWASPSFADWYKNATDQGTTGGGGGGGAKADLLHGWHSLQRALNTNWHRDLNRGERNLRLALRAFHSKSKVRR